MEIDFANTKLKKLCLNGRTLETELGAPVAKAFRLRYALLESAPSLHAVPTDPPTRRHLLGGDRKGQWSVTVKDGIRICLVPDHDPVPVLADGGVDLKSVTRVKIVFVGDYHP